VPINLGVKPAHNRQQGVTEMTTTLDLTDEQVGLITAPIQEEQQARSITAFASHGAAYRQIKPTDKPTPAAAKFQQRDDQWSPLLAKVASKKRPPPPLPTQLGPFNWNPITFNGFETHGWAQLTLFSNGAYNFTGSFTDPSAWDYDDSLAWGIVSSKGVLYTFKHTGSMNGWFDRWLEGGSDTDSWSNDGTNASIKGGWADLCAGWRWDAQAAINFDIGGLVTLVEDIIKDVEKVVQVIEVV
jgi:hypothetical protein